VDAEEGGNESSKPVKHEEERLVEKPDEEENYVINIVVSDFASGTCSRAHDVRSHLEDLRDLVNEIEATATRRNVSVDVQPREGISSATSTLHLERVLAEMRTKLAGAEKELELLCARVTEVEIERDQLLLMTEKKEEQIQEGLHERRSLLEKVRMLGQQVSLFSKPSAATASAGGGGGDTLGEKGRELESRREEIKKSERAERCGSIVDASNTQGLLEKV